MIKHSSSFDYLSSSMFVVDMYLWLRRAKSDQIRLQLCLWILQTSILHLLLLISIAEKRTLTSESFFWSWFCSSFNISWSVSCSSLFIDSDWFVVFFVFSVAISVLFDFSSCNVQFLMKLEISFIEYINEYLESVRKEKEHSLIIFRDALIVSRSSIWLQLKLYVAKMLLNTSFSWYSTWLTTRSCSMLNIKFLRVSICFHQLLIIRLCVTVAC